jgi:dipeptidyl aminopeptidase/acylaminoacyl peptidase
MKALASAAALLAATAMTTAALAAPAKTEHRFVDIAVSPDGNHIATVEGDLPAAGGYLPVVQSLVIRTADGKSSTTVPMPCGAVPLCWPASLEWSADGKTLAFALRKPGTHARSIYTVGVDGKHLTDLLDFNGTVQGLRYGPSGKLAVLAVEGANKEVGATQAGAAITGDLSGPVPEQRIGVLEGKSLHWASPSDMFVYQYDWKRDGSGFVGTAAHGDGDNNWWVAKLYAFSAKDGAANVIYTPQDAKHQIADPIVSRDGKTIAFISGIMSDFGSTGGDIYTMPVGGGTATNITPDMHASARTVGWSCDNHLRADLLAGSSSQMVDYGDGTKPATPTVLWQAEETAHGGEGGAALGCPSAMTAVIHETFNTAPELAVGEVGHWQDITHMNAGLSAPATAQSITWKNEGLDVQGWLLLPLHTQGKLPLITLVHGGPASAVGPGFIGPGAETTLLQHGYALFLPNPRGSFGQGEAFTQGNVRDLGHGDLRDILAGIDAVEKVAPVDENRLGLTGGSYGGFMTMWAVTQTNRFKAGVAAAGISNWQSYYGENGIDEWMIPYFGASVYDDPEIYAKSSAINYIKNVKTPVFSYVGAQDIECPAPQTEEFWHALNDLGVPTSYAIYPGEGHGLRDPAHVADADARTLAWFDKYLKP